MYPVAGQTCSSYYYICRYHHNAYFVQQAGETVKNVSIDSFEKFIVTMFQNQDGKIHTL